MRGYACAWALSAWIALALAVQQLGDLSRDLGGGDGEGGVELDISLRDAARGMAKPSGDRQFAASQVASDAGDGVSKNMRGDAGKFRLRANSIEHPNDTDEVPG